MAESLRRREYQAAYNQEQGIIPQSAIRRDDSADFSEHIQARNVAENEAYDTGDGNSIDELKQQMIAAAEELKFEEAARLRDIIHRLEGDGEEVAGSYPKARKRGRKRRRK